MLDSLGRDVGDIKGNVQAIKNQMLQDIGKSVTSNGTDAPKEVLKKIATQLETIVGYNLNLELKKFHDVLNTLADACKNLEKKKEDIKKEAKEMATAHYNDPTARADHALLKNIAANKVTIGGNGTARPIPGQLAAINNGVGLIGKLFQSISNFFKKSKGAASVAAGATGGGGGKGGGAKPVTTGGDDEYDENGKRIPKKKKETWREWFKRTGHDRGSEMTGLVTGGKPIEAIISGLGGLLSKGLSSIPFVGGFLGGLLDGILKPLSDELEYIRDMSRGMLNTYGTGIENLEKKMDEFRDASKKTVIATGQSQSLVLKEQVKYYQRGITDLKTQNSVMRIGLQTATLINSDAAQTSGMFADWSQHLGASEHQLNMMGRGLVNIGNQSGLTGANLLRVAESSKTFMENMRLAGTFTATAANNIMGIMAQAQKTGTTVGTSRIMAGLTGGLIGPGVDEGTKSTIMKAGSLGGANMMDLLAGTSSEDPEQMKRVASGLEQLVRIYSGGKNLNQMTMQERGLASQRMEIGERGLKLKEAILIAENLRKGAMSFDEQLTEIGDKLNKKIYAPEEARVLKENVLFAKASKTIEQFEGNLEQANPELKDALDQQVAIVNDRAQKSTGSNFRREADESNATLLERIQKADAEARMAAEVQKDPSLNLLTKIYNIEAEIRQFMHDLVMKTLPLLGSIMGSIWAAVQGAGEYIRNVVYPFFRTEVFPLFEKIGKWVLGIFDFIDPKSAKERAAADPLVLAGKTAVEKEGIANLANSAGGYRKMSPEQLAEEKIMKEKVLADRLAVKKEHADYLYAEREHQEWLRIAGAGGFRSFGKAITFGLTKGEWMPGTGALKQSEDNVELALEHRDTLNDSIRKGQYGLQAVKTEEMFRKALQNADWREKPDIQAKIDRYTELKKLKVGPNNEGLLDVIKATPEIMSIFKDLEKMAEGAVNKKGSIFTHDIHLEELLEGVPALVSAMMPGMDVDEEIQKRQIAIDDSNAEIEANTSDIASSARKTNILLNALGKMFAKAFKARATSESGNSGDVDESAFWEEILDTGWPNARFGRSVGLQLDWAEYN